jgi:hypothetical protein
MADYGIATDYGTSFGFFGDEQDKITYKIKEAIYRKFQLSPKLEQEIGNVKLSTMNYSLIILENKLRDQLERINKLDQADFEYPLPSDISFRVAGEFINNLIGNNITPDRITPSAEGGICFVFSNNKIATYFEIYNNGEMGYISEDIDKSIIIENKDITSPKEIFSVINK